MESILAAGEERPSKRLRQLEEAWELNEQKKMKHAHCQSALAERAAGGGGGEEKFATGQSVQHWWAHWFRTAKKPVQQINKKLRPSWYDAMILAALGTETVMYAGVSFTEPVYQVH